MIQFGYDRSKDFFVYSDEPIYCSLCNKKLSQLCIVFHTKTKQGFKKYIVCDKCKDKELLHKVSNVFSKQIAIILNKPSKRIDFEFEDEIELTDSRIRDIANENYNKDVPDPITDHTKLAGRTNLENSKIGGKEATKEIENKDTKQLTHGGFNNVMGSRVVQSKLKTVIEDKDGSTRLEYRGFSQEDIDKDKQREEEKLRRKKIEENFIEFRKKKQAG